MGIAAAEGSAGSGFCWAKGSACLGADKAVCIVATCTCKLFVAGCGCSFHNGAVLASLCGRAEP